MAPESAAEPLTESVLPAGLRCIPLPGHFFDMVGFRSADDVVYLADCLSSRETLEKYQIGFVYDVAAYLDTLERVAEMQALMFVPAHAEATDNIAPLARLNIRKAHEIAGRLLDLCKEPMIFEIVLQRLFNAYGLTMNFEQYVLVGSTVRSYLSWLKDTGRMEAIFDNGQLLWKTIG
jgi:glyoxylase-like metal-dependent hydrolase (beta-lactamase superfamily II)